MVRTLLASLVILASANAVHAQVVDAPPTVAVSYADLDLNTTAGAAALVQRLDKAARLSCGGATLNKVDLPRLQAFNSCRQAAVSEAVAKVGNPRVYAVSQGVKTGELAKR